MRYYKVNSRKVSLREYWNISSSLRGFISGVIYKVLGRPLRLSQGIPEQTSFRDKVVEEAEVPAPFLRKIDSAHLELKRLDFDQFWYYRLKSSLLPGDSCGLQALHHSRTAVGKIIFARTGLRDRLVVAFISKLSDGTTFATTDKKREFDEPPGCLVKRIRHASPTKLWDYHQARLQKLHRNNPPVAITNFDDVVNFENQTTEKSFRDKIARGVWVEMTDAEVNELRAKRTPKAQQSC